MRYLLLFIIAFPTIFLFSCTTQGKEKPVQGEEVEVAESMSIDKNLKVIITEGEKTHSDSFLQPNITGVIGVVVLVQSEDMELPPPPPTDVKMQFLNDDETEWLTFSFTRTDNYEKEHEKFMSKWEQGLDPRMIHFEYQILAMDCVAEDNDYYTVIVNKHSGDTKRLKKQVGLALQSWEQHILSTLIGVDESELRDSVDGKLVTLSVKDDTYAGIEVDGDWLKVAPIVLEDDTPKETAWVKWREGERLLIDLYYMF